MGSAEQPITRANLHEALTPRVAWLRRWVGRHLPVRLRPTISVDDILQEVWIAAYRAVDRFRADGPDGFERWLTRIAENKLTSAVRTARRLKRGGNARFVRDTCARHASLTSLFSRLQSPDKTPSRDARGREATHLLLIAMASLSNARRIVVELHYLQGFTYQEVAAHIGRSEAAVNNLLYAARADLRGILGSASRYFSDVRSSDAERAGQSDAACSSAGREGVIP